MNNYTTYEITIKKVNKTYVPETEEVYYNSQTGEMVTWSVWYHDKENHQMRKERTGKETLEITSEKIYEQEKDNLDVSELAIFINRVK